MLHETGLAPTSVAARCWLEREEAGWEGCRTLRCSQPCRRPPLKAAGRIGLLALGGRREDSVLALRAWLDPCVAVQRSAAQSADVTTGGHDTSQQAGMEGGRRSAGTLPGHHRRRSPALAGAHRMKGTRRAGVAAAFLLAARWRRAAGGRRRWRHMVVRFSH